MEEHKDISASVTINYKFNKEYNPILSIIVPVFNEEKNIVKCIDSIEHQKNCNYEIIIVDNNSTDNTYEVCQNLKNKYTNIRIFIEHKKGVSAARNMGLRQAKGNYIMFVDGDDQIPNNVLELILNEAIKNKSGITQARIMLENDYLNLSPSEYEKVILTSEYIQKITLYRNNYTTTEKEWVLDSVYGVFGKVFSRAILVNQYFYEDVSLGEDMLFYLEVLQKVETVEVISECIYIVNDHNNNSSTRRTNPLLAESVAAATDRLLKLYAKRIDDAELKINLDYQIFRHVEVGILEQIEKMCLNNSYNYIRSFAKKYLDARKSIYAMGYEVVLQQSKNAGLKRRLLYYLPIRCLKSGKYGIYCICIICKERLKRIKNGIKAKIN